MHPEKENTNCGVCKKYKHYSWRNPDKEKQGKPVYEFGLLVKRRVPLTENCPGCPGEKVWTEGNKEIYKKWVMAKDGFEVGVLDPSLLDLFFILSETAETIRRFHLENALLIGLIKAQNG